MAAFGKYRLLEPLASGGMADVWRAEVEGAEGVVKEVALKFVRGDHGERGEFVRMFVEEARLAARLSHANVVQLVEFGEVDGRYYIAMELVHGRHLGRVVERARELGLRPGLARAVHVGAEVAKGLAYAHRLVVDGRPVGLVHRDISPHNILVSFEGEVKLADFGIARAPGRAELTLPGTVKGKAAYMAPEQARAGAVDARADVFSLGVVLWELCAGRRLFLRDTEEATLAAVMGSDPISPPSAWNEGVPPELDAAILGALERDPSRRTRSAQDLAASLAGILLRLARSPEDWDLRAFMHRLWPEGATPAPRPPLERTVVRPATPASPEPVLGETVVKPAGPREAIDPTLPTRTAVAPRTTTGTTTRRRAWAVAAAVLVAGLAAGGWWVRGGGGPLTPTLSPAGAGERANMGGEGTNPGSTSTGVPAPAPPSAQIAPPSTQASAGDPVSTQASTAAQASVAAAAAAPAPAPAPAPGQGSLHVTASPWGRVFIDGSPAGETPVTLTLPAGSHRIRVAHERHGAREGTVEIVAGRRTAWHAPLATQ